MDKVMLDQAVDRVVQITMRAIDIYERDVIRPMLDEVQNPEKVIGKKYEEWGENDVQMLKAIYGDDSAVFNNFILKKELASVKELEAV